MSASEGKEPRLARIRATGAVVLIHPCSVCGAPNAPFGRGFNPERKRLGTWYCAAHVPKDFRKEP